ncbi:MAG TPA: aromatic ring-hydroxylating dioxygenase subunit alpha [Candidatus Acidoferrales bacterium]|nr:aromatic ring-hydroxylating dioxygenase subunit alpha [Candidatus Acidoferrales bacterium]
MKDDIEQLLDLGLRNLWYGLIPSSALGADPIALRRLGEDLVLWRDAGGIVHVQADRCPHRGARLSLGHVSGDRLTCWYHGVQVDGNGTIADVPALPGCPLVGRHGVRTFPSRELGGAIFAYFALDETEPPTHFGAPAEFEDPQWSHFLCSAIWKTNYRYAIENVVDPMHGSYLHSDSFTLAYGKKDDVLRIEETRDGFILERTEQRDVNFDWVEFFDSGAHWLRLDIPYPQSAGPGGPFRILGTVTPIDEHASQIFFWRLRKVTGWQRDLWRFMYRDRLEARHWAVLEQDRIMSETLPADARYHEMLYQHDLGITRFRKLLRARAKEQIEKTRRSSPKRKHMTALH